MRAGLCQSVKPRIDLAKGYSMRYLIELLLGWLIAKKNGGEYIIMEDEL